MTVCLIGQLTVFGIDTTMALVEEDHAWAQAV